ncbi:DUF6318 family protein [Quadrisphaera sp. DSM 44207]|uniref:DUF6318 family protein n=1 Tax=Quadrisphaera sp. DSM 44207 TaxID=1881057 RepID=UPI0008805096|nr:DUF6318 family protein [Quadrisphaera sp. DSM 44207]SDQ88204.1 hypothetical protein SAMN05428996_3012 [Quadrisphaera sp. DSM 44207]
MRPVVGVFAAVALITGCSDAGTTAEPARSAAPAVVTPTETRTPTETPTPIETPPVLPPEARDRTEAGAAAFASYWFDALEYGYRTGDTTLVEVASAPDCTECQNFVDIIESQYGDGGSIRGADLSVVAPIAAPMEDFGTLVSLTFSAAATQEIAPSGSVRGEVPAESPYQVLIGVEWLDDRWLAFGIAKDGM